MLADSVCLIELGRCGRFSASWPDSRQSAASLLWNGNTQRRGGRFRAVLLAVAGLSLTTAGCDSGYQNLSGTVTVDGQPAAAGVTVQFVPEGNTRPAEGIVDSTGRFVATSVGKAGVMPGAYKICLINSTESVPKPAGGLEATEEQEAAGIAPKGWFEYQAAVKRFLARPPTGKGWNPKFYSSPATSPPRWNPETDGFEVTLEVTSDDKPGL